MQLGFLSIRFQGTSDHRLHLLYLGIFRDICARISAFAVPLSGPGELTGSETVIRPRLPAPRYLILQVLNALSILSEFFDGLVHDFEAQETLIVLLDLQIAILIAHVKAVFSDILRQHVRRSTRRSTCSRYSVYLLY